VTDDLEEIQEALDEDLVGQTVRGVRVAAADVSPSMNPHAPDTLVVLLTLSDPEDGETWKLAVTDAIRDRAERKIASLGVEPSSVAFTFEAEHPDFGEE